MNLTAKDLPDNVVFHVHGSAGVLNERERATNFLNASNFVVQLAANAQALGKQLDVNLEEIASEAYKLSGIQNAARFIGTGQTDVAAPEGGPGLPGADGTDAAVEDILAAVAPQPIA